MNYVLDTETERGGAFRLGVLQEVESGDSTVYRDAESMRQAVGHLPQGSIVWGHNVSYDLLVLWRGSVGAWFVNGRFRRAEIRGVRFRDTMSYFELPLADAAPMAGERKSGDGGASLSYGDTELADYCVQDCRATAALVRSIEATAGSLGLDPDATGPGAWARGYFRRQAPWTERYPDDLVLATPDGIVRGGLVLYRQATIASGEKWDVKSAYPYQMLAGSFPDLRYTGEQRGGVSVIVRYRDPESGRMVWGPPEEMEAAGVRRLAGRIACPRARWIPGSPFAGFVRGLMAARNAAKRANDPARDYLVKRTLNSLSGCLGARTRPMFVRNGVATGGGRGALPGTRAVWAALVTGRQRARLRNSWKLARGPVYSDTDSLVCEKFGGDGLGDETCGRWVLEEMFDEAWVLGPKMYATLAGGVVKSAHVKGIPKRLAAEAIARHREGGATVLEWDAVATYREAAALPSLWLKRRRDPFVAVRQADGARQSAV